jgi:hypothetical protein
MRLSIKYAVLALGLAASLPAMSGSLPDYYPAKFDRWGVIDALDLGNQIIVVNDAQIHVARDLQVHTLNTRFATARTLTRGMKIGFGTTGSRGLTGPVTEVWVLPVGYIPSRRDPEESGHD